MHVQHAKDCKCDRCKEHERIAKTMRVEAERLGIERAALDTLMVYTAPGGGHKSDEHQKMCAAADAVRAFEKKHGSRP